MLPTSQHSVLLGLGWVQGWLGLVQGGFLRFRYWDGGLLGVG